MTMTTVLSAYLETGATYTYMPVSAAEVSTVSMEEWRMDGVGGPGASQQELMYVDPQGEVFVNPTGGEMRGCDPKGCGYYGASRHRDWGQGPHLGIDLMSIPGQSVFAPFHGIVYDHPSPPFKYQGVVVVGNGYTAGMYYTTATDRIRNAESRGLTVNAGEIIGTANDITGKYSGITNHVHFQLQQSGSSLFINPTPFIFPGRR